MAETKVLYNNSILLSLTAAILPVAVIFLQIAALVSTRWASFSARTEIGKPKEDGHYGLWSLCFTKGPHWTEDCDPLDTFFQTPPYTNVAGVLGIIHMVLVLIILPLAINRAIQLIKNKPSIGFNAKILCIAKACLAFVIVIFGILVAIFVSVEENRPAEYVVRKGWSFWVQITVIVLDVVIVFICVTENFRFWREHIQRQKDPLGHRAEAYGNPAFNSGSPSTNRRDNLGNQITYTQSSGEPSIPSEPRASVISNPHNVKISETNGVKSSINFRNNNKDEGSKTITYENPSFQENSPSLDRHF